MYVSFRFYLIRNIGHCSYEDKQVNSDEGKDCLFVSRTEHVTVGYEEAEKRVHEGQYVQRLPCVMYLQIEIYLHA
jgi:hypothetical protein